MLTIQKFSSLSSLPTNPNGLAPENIVKDYLFIVDEMDAQPKSVLPLIKPWLLKIYCNKKLVPAHVEKK
ncbi:hypothetical protein [Weizmannia ginsengihumi]|uniref:Uncharacterized protein n=1 Tax=Heyndrickxia ginsengihumi TaxID=363870 RepID=A0A0A6VB57_9BACI|nr:hypothetical protein NG54_09050 [Heyndrickxia ginsengihumi]MBE6183143.1 hypothetical protein [Bacillus sp. (in: firmicutes)]MCM3024869.1 hypothetical protein [Heyndrickxia ginsengihumi]